MLANVPQASLFVFFFSGGMPSEGPKTPKHGLSKALSDLADPRIFLLPPALETPSSE